MRATLCCNIEYVKIEDIIKGVYETCWARGLVIVGEAMVCSEQVIVVNPTNNEELTGKPGDVLVRYSNGRLDIMEEEDLKVLLKW